ncbi:phage tail assembly chaperone [Roseomonas mucosa]|uniref:phage tail assembly chaperone n=1 Tax=Roseomonas mucosa TaxID=207340 RepID=UPI003BAF294C
MEETEEEERPDKPEVEDWLAWVWRAWWALHDERSHTLVGISVPLGAMILKPRPGRIPWSAVDRWCRRHRYPRSQQDFLHRMIRAMDLEFLTWWASKEGKA